MKDVVVLVITLAFFALCVAYVRWCDRIIGPDPDGLGDDDVEETMTEPGVVDVAAAAGATPVERAAEAVRS